MITPQYVASLQSRGIDSIPPDIAKKLTLTRWYKDFLDQVGLWQMELFCEWWLPQFEKLRDSGMDDEEQLWLRLTAQLGLLESRFFSYDLALPQSWVKDQPYCKETYSLVVDVETPISSKEFYEWSENYSHPDRVYVPEGEHNFWLLQHNLANEYVRDIYFKKVRFLITKIGRKSTTEEIVKRNAELRDLIAESTWYDGGIRESFYRNLPDFKAEFESLKDPVVKHFFSQLERTFRDSDTKIEFGFLKKEFASYWETLEGMVESAEGKKTIEVIKSETECFVNDLVRENRRLQRKIDLFEGE